MSSPKSPLWDWLTTTGSLTARLKAHYQTVRVELLLNQWGLAWAEEAAHLTLEATEQVLVREVFLVCDGMAMVFARTIMPTWILAGAEAALADLGNRPLGEYLFQHPKFKRMNLMIAPLASDHALSQRALSAPTVLVSTNNSSAYAQPSLWARHSLFLAGEKRLLVTEVFTPPFLAMLTT
jgi:chorismate--pyruvate lyase